VSKRVVILGGGFAGLRVFYHLRALDGIELVIIDPRETSLVRPVLPEVALAGKPLEHAQIPLRALVERHGGKFVRGEVELVEAREARVRLQGGAHIAYDYLLVAAGAKKDYDALAGYREFGYSVCDDTEAPKLAERLRGFSGGRIVIGSAKSTWGHRIVAPELAAPCEGPVAEIMFMLDHELRRTGVRNGSSIRVFSPGKIFFEDVGPRVHADVEPLVKASGIRVETNKTLVAIAADHVEFADGSRWESDLAIVIPPYAAHAFVTNSAGLGDERGFIPTDETMRHLDFRNIYAAGDGNALAMPKLGHIAIHQADIVAAALRHALTGKGEIPPYRPEIFCIANRGGSEATLILSNSLFGGNIDLTLDGPIAHLLKWSFDSYYFYTKGHMPPDVLSDGMEGALERLFNRFGRAAAQAH
jgi:sulfide:quinone oxidoreductase